MTATAGLAFTSSVISLTKAGIAVRTICGSTIRRSRKPAVMPAARAASSWSRGNSTSAPRQISQLNAAVLSVSVVTAAGTVPISMPATGRAKKMSKPSVTAGDARSRLTSTATTRPSTGTPRQRTSASSKPSGRPIAMLASDRHTVTTAPRPRL